eukprot:627355-Hanusia_phi.AAC.1
MTLGDRSDMRPSCHRRTQTSIPTPYGSTVTTETGLRARRLRSSDRTAPDSKGGRPGPAGSEAPTQRRQFATAPDRHCVGHSAWQET